MRNKAVNGPLSVHAIAGTHVVLLGIDMEEGASRGVLGFAIERTDHTENERYWLRGLRTFEETDPGVPGLLVSTLEHPFQSFLWGDYTAKTRHSYTYRVVAMRGKPKKLERSEEVEVHIETEDDSAGKHAVFFNRGVAGSQAYSRKFGDKAPDDVPGGEAWRWLSRGLEEALLDFIGQAEGERYALRAAVYEFQYEPVLRAFATARDRGADVKVVYDARTTSHKTCPAEANREAIAKAGIEDLVIPRTATPSYIAHNKFVVLLEDGEPRQVWTGSTNITAGGIFGHSNVGHVVRDPAVAAKYLSYWEELRGDPEARELRPLVEETTPVPEDAPEPNQTTVLFSPRSSLRALEWYAERMDAAKTSLFFTAAFGINELIERVLEEDKEYLRYVLLEREDEDMEVLLRDPDNRFVVGAKYGDTQLGNLLAERLSGLNSNIFYVHTKYALVDPLSDDPLVITGSANFSEPSIKNNDENMLVIRGDARVADVYLGELMRLFNHFFVRNLVRRQRDPSISRRMHLSPDDSWREAHYRDGPQQKERLYFADGASPQQHLSETRGVHHTMSLVLAHFMNEEERQIALEVMPQGDETDSYILGDIDESEIRTLEQHGLIVERLQEDPVAETPGKQAEELPGLQRRPPRSETDSVGQEPPRYREGVAHPPNDEERPNFYLIRIHGPLLERWRRQLNELNVQILAYVHRNHYTTRLDPQQARNVEELPFVTDIRLYGPEDTGPITIARERGEAFTPPGIDRAMMIYDLRLHRDEEEDRVRVAQRLEQLGVSIAGTTNRTFRIYLLEDSDLALQIADIPEIAEMSEYIPPRLHNDEARIVLGVEKSAPSKPPTVVPQTGKGQIVAIADSGLDNTHPDFKGRIVGLVGMGRPGDTSDPNGHGTHVAGSVLGDGSASGGALRGIASEAELYFQSLLDASGELGGLPTDPAVLFGPAYHAGARIHNNSWGSATPSLYTADATKVDEFVETHRDMLIVVSAGNEGRSRSKPGFVDLSSISSPASAKNVLCVGASRSSRISGGYARMTYGQNWPTEFPDPPVADERVSGHPEGLAAFSGRGPTTDKRVKPDVVAPGTDVASAKAAIAALRRFWGPYGGNPHYAYMGGTSMAAPLVAGCAALIRQYYCEEESHNPSAALLKATIINSARWLTGDSHGDAVADPPGVGQPNCHQGFGCVYMPWAIPNPLEPNLKLDFIDPWADDSMHLRQEGHEFQFIFSVSGGEWLRICLTWTDPPGRWVQHKLNLTLEDLTVETKPRRKWLGNDDMPRLLRFNDLDPKYDEHNNVEVIRIERPKAGDYKVSVKALELPRLDSSRSTQDFALVVTGDLTSKLREV